MKSSEGLRAARKLIAEVGGGFLCTSLKFCKAEHTEVYRNLQEVFTDGPYTAAQWAAIYAPDYTEKIRNNPVAYRLAWIDWLIPQYEEKGD